MARKSDAEITALKAELHWYQTAILTCSGMDMERALRSRAGAWEEQSRIALAERLVAADRRTREAEARATEAARRDAATRAEVLELAAVMKTAMTALNSEPKAPASVRNALASASAKVSLRVASYQAPRTIEFHDEAYAALAATLADDRRARVLAVLEEHPSVALGLLLSAYSELDAENARIGGEIRVARQEIANRDTAAALAFARRQDGKGSKRGPDRAKILALLQNAGGKPIGLSLSDCSGSPRSEQPSETVSHQSSRIVRGSDPLPASSLLASPGGKRSPVPPSPRE